MEIDGKAIREAIGITNGCPYFNSGRKYVFARINLVKAGAPVEILHDGRYERLHQSLGMPIVIEKNRRQFGYVAATDYFPSSIIVCGTAKRTKLLGEGNVKGWAWIEKGALNIQADDCISSQELMDKLQTLLVERYVKVPNSLTVQPWILALYPFENYLIYSLNGQKYRQGYNLEPISRSVALAGQPQAVKEQYINANINRDFMATMCQRWSKPQIAIAMFYNDVKHGLYRLKSLKASAPNIEGAIFELLAGYELSYPDFVQWSSREFADNSYRNVKGCRIARHKFRTIDKRDKSTWVPLVRKAKE